MRKSPEGARFSRMVMYVWSCSPRRAPPVGLDRLTVKVSLASGSASRIAQISSVWKYKTKQSILKTKTSYFAATKATKKKSPLTLDIVLTLPGYPLSRVCFMSL